MISLYIFYSFDNFYKFCTFDIFYKFCTFHIFNTLYTLYVDSVELDDPVFTRFMKLNKDANEMIGNGFVEDLFPFMTKIWTTKKYQTVMNIVNEFYGIINNQVEDHRKAFDPSKIYSKLRVHFV